ncbi:MAG: M20 family metallo-hydrolase [Flammeovirgaceae bacterium]
MKTSFQEIIALLQLLIQTPSFSREEDKTATILQQFLEEKGVRAFREKNNVWAFNLAFNPQKVSILLNSHHDTVKPNATYTRNPFEAKIEDGKLYGLGSNDAGGSLVALLATFLHFYDDKHLPFNLIIACTAEEEISGKEGIESILPQLGNIAFAIVGEPTKMQMAIAEKGLMVLDCYARGKAAHAARDEGDNAIYHAIKDIEWFRNYDFPKTSETLGKIKMSVTQINAGSQHNIVPDVCHFVVDVRTTDAYTNEETLMIIQSSVRSEVKARSTRLKPSSISLEHPIVQAGIRLGRSYYGSPTLSDQALLNCPSLKLGVGDSARSHTADEFVYVEEIKEGIDLYIRMLEEIKSYYCVQS